MVNNGDIVYLLSTANKRVYRWSIATGAYLRPYVVGSNQGYNTLAPTHGVFGGQQRLYLGYSTGAIRYIDVNGSRRRSGIRHDVEPVYSLVTAGNFLIVQTSRWQRSGYMLNSAGVTTAQSGTTTTDTRVIPPGIR